MTDLVSIQEKITFYDPTLLHCTRVSSSFEHEDIVPYLHLHILIIMTNRKMKMQKHH